MKKIVTFFTFFIFLIILSGCVNTDNNNNENSSSTEESRILTDGLGNEVEIPASPQRIIASYLEDYLVALGVTPVAQWSVNDGASILNYLQDSLEDIPNIPHDLPFESVMSFNPDLILIESSGLVEGGRYEQYNAIAPTYVVHDSDITWRERLLEIGTVLNMEDKANYILEEYELKAIEAREKIQEVAKGESAAVIWIVNNSAFIVRDNASSGAVLYNDLGLEVPSLVEEISASANFDWSDVSLERLAELDADHIFLVNSDVEIEASLLQDSIWQNIPAVRNGNVYEFGPETSWLYNGPIANSQIIDNVLDSIVR